MSGVAVLSTKKNRVETRSFDVSSEHLELLKRGGSTISKVELLVQPAKGRVGGFSRVVVSRCVNPESLNKSKVFCFDVSPDHYKLMFAPNGKSESTVSRVELLMPSRGIRNSDYVLIQVSLAS